MTHLRRFSSFLAAGTAIVALSGCATSSGEFDSSKGPQAHTYVGALLSDVVDSADPREVDAAASDGYDGQPLGHPRLVVPSDKKGGRYVSDLTELTVVDAGA
jgi:hypothetical protein